MARVACYHEAGHAIVARALGRRVDAIHVAPFGAGGVTKQKPLDRALTDQDCEALLAIIYAGSIAAAYA